MKNIKYFLLLNLCVLLLCFSNCGEETPEPTQKEIKTGYLINKSNGWVLKSISVPINSATTEDQWVDFKLTVSSSTMSTSSHPSGASVVWPTGGWTMNESGNTITRADGIVMSVHTLSATNFKVSFIAPEGTVIGGRITALDGDYVFDLE